MLGLTGSLPICKKISDIPANLCFSSGLPKDLCCLYTAIAQVFAVGTTLGIRYISMVGYRLIHLLDQALCYLFPFSGWRSKKFSMFTHHKKEGEPVLTLQIRGLFARTDFPWAVCGTNEKQPRIFTALETVQD